MNFRKIYSIVKVVGMVIMLGGVMVMILYKGLVIEIVKVVYFFFYGGLIIVIG